MKVFIIEDGWTEAEMHQKFQTVLDRELPPNSLLVADGTSEQKDAIARALGFDPATECVTR